MRGGLILNLGCIPPSRPAKIFAVGPLQKYLLRTLRTFVIGGAEGTDLQKKHLSQTLFGFSLYQD